MKKLICAAAALLTGLSLSIAASAKDLGTVTVLGDSIATGYGLAGYTSGDNYSAEGSFGSLISRDCSDYTNLARDGATGAELLELLDGGEALEAVSEADSVIISIGGNDFLRPMLASVQQAMLDSADLFAGVADGSVSPEEVLPQLTEAIISAAQSVDVEQSGKNISGIIGKIRGVNPDCGIYILTVYDPFEDIAGMEAIASVASERLPQLNAEISAAAAANGASVIDVYSAFEGHAAEYTNIGIMDIHPSAAGHEVIYSLLSGAMGETAPSTGGASDSGTGSGAAKPSPDTGAPAAAFAGAAALTAAAALVISRRKKDR